MRVKENLDPFAFYHDDYEAASIWEHMQMGTLERFSCVAGDAVY